MFFKGLLFYCRVPGMPLSFYRNKYILIVPCEIHVQGKFQMINILNYLMKELQEWNFYSQFSKSSSYPCENHSKGAKK